MKDLLDFWGKTKIMMNNTKGGEIKILAPSNSLADRIRKNYMKKLIKFVIKEQQYFTLTDLL